MAGGLTVASEHTTRVYAEGDPDMPEEFRTLLIRMLSNHLENTANPHYITLLNRIWERGMTLIPDDKTKVAYARLMLQEVEHGVITARLLDGLGGPRVDQPIKQYLFDLPLDTFCDLAFFNGIGDRVGIYIGETWSDVPYAPLRSVAPKLHKDEVFHATFGLRNLRRICSTPEGLAEANDKVKIWWPAALDMFGRSDSGFSQDYVRWGLRQEDNEELRRRYIADTRPLLTELGIDVPDDRANRRFL
ncbi:MAG: Phenylacetic acid catabolic protein [Actinomycetota bacterium]